MTTIATWRGRMQAMGLGAIAGVAACVLVTGVIVFLNFAITAFAAAVGSLCR